MIRWLSIAGISFSLLACVAQPSADPDATRWFSADAAADAPKELAHWSKMIGRWSTREEGLSPDGSEWSPSKGADWEFLWAFDGHGIQDNYTSPPLSESVDDERLRQRGTNLRIYDAKNNQWVMTWLTVQSTQAARFTAQSTDDEIVMRAEALTPTGFHSRIIFFNIKPDSFDWKLEYSKDEQNWFEVYRIFGTRQPES